MKNSVEFEGINDIEFEDKVSHQRQKLMAAVILDNHIDDNGPEMESIQHELQDDVPLIDDKSIISRNLNALEEMDYTINSLKRWQEEREKERRKIEDCLNDEKSTVYDFELTDSPETNENSLSNITDVDNIKNSLFIYGSTEINESLTIEQEKKNRRIESLQQLISNPLTPRSMPLDISSYLTRTSYQTTTDTTKSKFPSLEELEQDLENMSYLKYDHQSKIDNSKISATIFMNETLEMELSLLESRLNDYNRDLDDILNAK